MHLITYQLSRTYLINAVKCMDRSTVIARFSVGLVCSAWLPK